MKTIEAVRAVTAVRDEHERIVNNAEKTFGTEWMPGDVTPQGDVIIVCVKSMPKSAKPRANRQLADGDTMGARHVLTGGHVFSADPAECRALVKRATGMDIADKYFGPVFRGPAFLDHPEHGPKRWSGKCVNVVVYQRVWDAEKREEARARD